MCKLNDELKDEEIKQAIFDMTPWKSLRPNEYPAGLFQKSWIVVGENVCNFIQNMWDNPCKIEEINQTELCLIPEDVIPEQVS